MIASRRPPRGASSAVAALMAWLYLTALAALIGAEIDGARFDHNGNGVGLEQG